MKYLIISILLVLFTPFYAISQKEKINLDSGLVAYYPFNGNANDESGNGNNGMVYGAVLTSDRFGNPNSAYSFDGFSSYISLKSYSQLNLDTSSRTFCAWVKTASSASQTIFCKALRNLPWTGYGFRIDQYPQCTVIQNQSFNEFLEQDTKFNISDNNWHLLIATYQNNGNINFYVDCKKITSFTTQGHPGDYNSDDTCAFEIGSRGNNDGYPTGAYFWNGDLDDIRVYNRVLNESEIQYLSLGFSLFNNIGKEDTTMCKGNSLILNAGNQGARYKWSNGDTTQTITISKAGEYMVTVTNGNCSDSGSVNVIIDPQPPVNLVEDTSICQGNSLTLDASGGQDTLQTDHYTWNNNSKTNTITVNNTGIYTVTITDIYGCNAIDTFNITALPPPLVNSGVDTITIDNNSVILVPKLNSDSVNNTYTWSDNSHNKTLYANKSGLYSVTVTNKNGCSDSMNFYVKIIECNIFLPNAFTPNGDHLNDIYMPSFSNYECFVENYNMLIFNRWGEIIFESFNINEGWDGKFKGGKCPNGVYFCIVTFTDFNNNNKVCKTSNVTLLR